MQKVAFQIVQNRFSLLQKLEIPWPGHVNSEKIVGAFYEKKLQRKYQKWFRVERVIKRKGDKLYVKWKGHDNSFNSWIDKENIAT